MPPFFEHKLDVQELSVADIVILLHRSEFLGEEGTWMEFGRVPLLLRQHRSYPSGQSINLHNEGLAGV